MEVSNYIKMRDQMQERFLTYDQKEIEGKYGFAFDDDYFYVPYLFEEWRVNRHTGVVEGSKDHFLHVHQGSFNETLTISHDNRLAILSYTFYCQPMILLLPHSYCPSGFTYLP